MSLINHCSDKFKLKMLFDREEILQIQQKALATAGFIHCDFKYFKFLFKCLPIFILITEAIMLCGILAYVITGPTDLNTLTEVLSPFLTGLLGVTKYTTYLRFRKNFEELILEFSKISSAGC